MPVNELHVYREFHLSTAMRRRLVTLIIWVALHFEVVLASANSAARTAKHGVACDYVSALQVSSSLDRSRERAFVEVVESTDLLNGANSTNSTSYIDGTDDVSGKVTFSVGDRVRSKTTGKEGTVVSIDEDGDPAVKDDGARTVQGLAKNFEILHKGPFSVGNRVRSKTTGKAGTVLSVDEDGDPAVRVDGEGTIQGLAKNFEILQVYPKWGHELSVKLKKDAETEAIQRVPAVKNVPLEDWTEMQIRDVKSFLETDKLHRNKIKEIEFGAALAQVYPNVYPFDELTPDDQRKVQDRWGNNNTPDYVMNSSNLEKGPVGDAFSMNTAREAFGLARRNDESMKWDDFKVQFNAKLQQRINAFKNTVAAKAKKYPNTADTPVPVIITNLLGISGTAKDIEKMWEVFNCKGADDTCKPMANWCKEIGVKMFLFDDSVHDGSIIPL